MSGHQLHVIEYTLAMPDFELIVFAAVAIFVISRLYAVLGRKTGAEPPSYRDSSQTAGHSAQEDAPAEPIIRPAFSGPGAAGMEAIVAVDPRFDPREFVHGARQAYEMIVNAYADGDISTLKSMLDNDVFEAFSGQIEEREKAGTEPLRLSRIKSAEIAGAELSDNGMAEVSVSFEAALTDGEHQRTAKEIWTFERLAESKDPNWLLSEVSQAS